MAVAHERIARRDAVSVIMPGLSVERMNTSSAGAGAGTAAGAKAIRFGLEGIKGVGGIAVDSHCYPQ